MGTELTGEDFLDQVPGSDSADRSKRGRPSEIEPAMLQRDVTEIEFVLEQNWGEVGWLLSQAQTIADVQTAFRKIVNPKCSLMEPFAEARTRAGTSKELRPLRNRVTKATELHRQRYAQSQHAQEAIENAVRAWSAESNPVKRAQVQAIRPNLERDHREAKALEENSRSERDTLKTELQEREAYFAQSEILRFIQSDRHKFTPMNIARAMAGLPAVTARTSCDLCTKYGIDPMPGMSFKMFATIRRVLNNPKQDLGGLIDAMREHLLHGAEKKSAHASNLRRNWYFLESAIRSVAQDRSARRDSLEYRVFSEYCRTLSTQSAADVALASAHKLVTDYDLLIPERGPYLRTQDKET